MRTLEDVRPLFGQGYTVIGGKKMHYETMHEEECWPIIAPEENLDYLVEMFRFDDEDVTFQRDIRENITTILHGNHPVWRLISFNLWAGCLYLVFYNVKTDSRHYGYFHEDTVSIDFIVPQPDGSPEEKYSISICYKNRKHCSTTMKEDIGNIHQEIDFYFINPNKTNPFKDRQYIEVTNYANYR